jgi:hypothetical protein
VMPQQAGLGGSGSAARTPSGYPHCQIVTEQETSLSAPASLTGTMGLPWRRCLASIACSVSTAAKGVRRGVGVTGSGILR